VALRDLVQKTAASVASIPSPIGGWNARDSIANMDPVDAVQLTNLFPNVNNVVLRGGYTNWATGLPGQVQTLANYSSGTENKLFAWAGTAIYDVTTTGVVGPAETTPVLTNAKWEYINVTTAGGSYLYAVNGVDAPLLYNNTTWESITDVSSPIAITNITPSTTLSNIALHKTRVWFIQKDTLKAWYLPTNAVGGAAQALDMSAIARLGGTLVDVSTWTIDAGYGVDDNLVFITSKGEAIVWSGTDPSDANAWALIGVWIVGEPIGNRCLLKYGGDILLLTMDGLVPLAGGLQSSRLDPQVNLSNKIQGAFDFAAINYGSNFGWQIYYLAKQNAVWVNVPISEGSQQQQYVMNNTTKAWANFTNWYSNCWETFSDDPYFGGDGVVGKAWTDNYVDNVSNIQTVALQAPNYFGSRGVKKYWTRARPSIFTDGQPAIAIGMNVDFDVSDTTAALSFTSTSVGLWDTGVWDTALWGSGLQITNNWQGITGIGYCGSIQFKSSSAGLQMQWASTDIVYQTGWAGI
jgi:hypothetical protein